MEAEDVDGMEEEAVVAQDEHVLVEWIAGTARRAGGLLALQSGTQTPSTNTVSK